ncbi:MAG TPA: heavy metal transport/detoxification protein [Flavisolibacter sp.]
MQTLQFKTNIRCSGCVAQSTPHLDAAVGADQWQVDTADRDKILTVTVDSSSDEQKVITAVNKAGFIAERI